jgi:hypothetical protein
VSLFSVTIDGAYPKRPSQQNPLDMGSLGQCDDHDAHDDELQGFSKGRVALQCSALRQVSSRGGM